MRHLLPLTFLTLIVGATSLTPAPATQPATDDQKMQAWWEDLAKEDPAASRALLNFADHPLQSVTFIKAHLKPLIISEDEVNKLIADLGSDDEKVWKPAFEKLEYFDPRLAIDLPTLMADNTEPVSRNRLVEVLSGRPTDSLSGKSIELRPLGSGSDGYNFFDGRSSWWAERKVERLRGVGWGNPKRLWTRACRAIVLLEHIGTPDAIAILRDLSTGNPDAEPTKTAMESLDKVESADK